MNSRERARRILNHQEADRPAIDLGSTVTTGTSGWSYRALKRALGLPSESVRVQELFQMLADVDTDVMDALGVDFVMLPKEDWFFGTHYGPWKPFTFWDGQTFDVPVEFNPVVLEDGSLEIPWQPGDPPNTRLPAGGWFFDRVPGRHRDPLSAEPMPPSEWQFTSTLSEELLRSQEQRAKELYASSERSLVAESPAMTPSGYGDLYWWAIQMMTEPAYCEDYMMRAAEAAASCIEQYLQAVGDYIDVLAVNLSDFGTQDREWFRPELFRDFYVPAWRLCSDVVHRFPGVKTWIHCCGSVPRLVPYFIEAGIDCLNPVQWTAAGMDLATLKHEYGDRLVFWGGAISTQRTFPFGTAEQVAAEAQEVLEIMAPGGGYVVNPIHNILPEVPVENILALYRTAQAYRYPSATAE
jgi:uroporphyrinogen decarboxylase